MITSSLIAQATESVQLPSSQVKSWVLDNGLTILVKEDHSAPVASVQAWCETGSIDEGKWMGAGLSHILEHMLFKGTKKRGANEIANEIQDQGGYVNAYTSFDRTVYWIDIPKNGVATALDVLADAMMNSTLPEDEYVKEQEVIRREYAMGMDDPQRVGQKQLFATAYQVHPYGQPVIGYLEIYNKLTRNDVMEYYKKRYVPNNLFFVVVGDVDASTVKAQLEKFFADYPRQALEPVVLPQEPTQLARRTIHTEFPTELSRLSMAWHIPGITDPDVPALDLLASILGDGKSARLYRELREKKGLAHGISAASYTPGDSGLFFISAMTDPDKREAVEKEVLAMTEAVKTTEISEKELEKVKRQMLSAQIATLTTMNGQASDIGSSWFLLRDADFTANYLKAIQAVTVDDIHRVAKKYLTDNSLTISSLDPIGSLSKNEKQDSQQTEYPIEKIILPNGLRLLVREDPRLPLVSVNMNFRGGVLAETPENNGITPLFTRLLLKGTTKRSGEQIAEDIESLGGSISTNAGNNSFSISVDGMTPDLKQMMELLSDVVLHPTFPDSAQIIEKNAQLAAIKAQQDQPTAIAGDLLREALFAGHPYALNPLGTPKSIESISTESLKHYQANTLIPNNAVLSVFGDVKASEVKALVEQYFGEWKKGVFQSNDASPSPLTQNADVKKIMDKNQAILMVGYRGVDVADSDRYALELINEACSDLGSRFFIRIREEMGLAYFVSTSMTPGIGSGRFIFYLGTDPTKVKEVREAFVDEIHKLAKDGLTETELNRAKKKWLGQMDIGNQSNAVMAQKTALDELYGLGYDHETAISKIIENISLEDVKRVCQKFFLDKPSVIALVTPETKVPATSAPQQEEEK